MKIRLSIDVPYVGKGGDEIEIEDGKGHSLVASGQASYGHTISPDVKEGVSRQPEPEPQPSPIILPGDDQ